MKLKRKMTSMRTFLLTTFALSGLVANLISAYLRGFSWSDQDVFVFTHLMICCIFLIIIIILIILFILFISFIFYLYFYLFFFVFKFGYFCYDLRVLCYSFMFTIRPSFDCFDLLQLLLLLITIDYWKI